MQTHLIILTMIITSALISCSDNQEKKNVDQISNQNFNDSIFVIKDTFSFEHPFGEEPLILKNETLKSVKGLLGDTIMIKTEGPRKIADFDEELIGFSRGNSTITAFNNSVRIGMILYSAEIRDSLPIFKNNVIVGMAKKDLIKIFNLPKESLTSNVLEIHYGEATSYVYLIFESNTLKKVLFWPYTG